ncbi:hypothetical protein HD553DRAFT_348475 [Filobasidium floriforme]|uniref:uncharacterized protein n=1 Tax=Filobasidium floriforme TaxID=5210 RepID=UPI001E8EEDA0|nr:uncharacterized protein HD553DRAFT_348475 [Filobasidium floriforme]KAH8087919.1 hypothetical protein HD553DRAFT_348475 [Filobasidium floriforme]
MNTSNTNDNANANVNNVPPSAFSPTRPSHQRRMSTESTSSTITTTTTSPSRRKPVSYLPTDEMPSHYLLQQGHSGSSTTLPIPITPGNESTLKLQHGGEEEGKNDGPIGGMELTTGRGLIKPPAYILEVEMPTTTNEGDVTPAERTRSSTPPPTYIYPPPTSPSSTLSTTTSNTLPLPTYTPEASTEPQTLPRQLFMYGFLFPPLWALGAILLCVPLKVYEEDFELDFQNRHHAEGQAQGQGRIDVERGREVAEGEEHGGELWKMKKRERELLDDKVIILRRAEIRWARYCAIGFASFLGLVIVAVAVVLFVTRR